eukprot:1635862-Amphidinium_carterae.1
MSEVYMIDVVLHPGSDEVPQGTTISRLLTDARCARVISSCRMTSAPCMRCVRYGHQCLATYCANIKDYRPKKIMGN